MVLLAGGSYREAVLGTLFSLNNESLNAWSTACGFCFITCLYIYSMCAASEHASDLSSSVGLRPMKLQPCSLSKLSAQHHAEAFLKLLCLPDRHSECCQGLLLRTHLLHVRF